jgi:hypothetical protein
VKTYVVTISGRLHSLSLSLSLSLSAPNAFTAPIVVVVTRGSSDTWRRRVLNGTTLRLTHDMTTTPLAGGFFFFPEKPFFHFFNFFLINAFGCKMMFPFCFLVFLWGAKFRQMVRK